jgi:Uma2 family endonuclease
MANQMATVERKLFTVEEYEQMIRAGVLHEDDRFELIAGEVIAMSPIGRAHAAHVNRLNYLLSSRLGERVIVSVQNPIRLADSEPQPDLALLAPRADYYAQDLPGPDDVWLVIEVADTTSIYDRSVKVPLYGRSGIPEVWLIDLVEGVIEVYRVPVPIGYRTKETYGPGDSLAPLRLPDLRLVVEEIVGLPPPDEA